MARQLLVVAIILIAIVGMTFSAADPPVATAGEKALLLTQGEDSLIGSLDGDIASDATPVGGPVSEDAFPKGAAGPGGASDASSLKLSFASASSILTTIATTFIFTAT